MFRRFSNVWYWFDRSMIRARDGMPISSRGTRFRMIWCRSEKIRILY